MKYLLGGLAQTDLFNATYRVRDFREGESALLVGKLLPLQKKKITMSARV